MDRVDRVTEAWDASPPGPYVAHTGQGVVVLESVRGRVDGSGTPFLDVTVGGRVPDPHYRVVNPPLLVPDPNGPVERDGSRYREDPLGALALAIAGAGGASRAVRKVHR